MNKKQSYSVEEFRELVKTGKLVYGNKGFRSENPLSESGKKPRKRKVLTMDDSLIIDQINKFEKQGKIYIPYTVRSSKNSKRIISKGDKKLVVNSRAVVEYEALSFKWWKYQRTLFEKLTENKGFPLKIGFYFMMPGNFRFDYSNLMQLPMDFMVKYGWLKDDNKDMIIPIADGWEVNKEIRGLVITIN